MVFDSQVRREALERLIVEEVARVLGLDRGGLAPGRQLFGLGLDSLSAIELAAAIEARTGVALPLETLFEGATLASLAETVAERIAAGASASPPPAAMEPEEDGPGEHPLSEGQRALWFADRLAPESAVYNLAGAARVHGTLDTAALGRSFAALVERHPALRTTFTGEQEEPRRQVHARLPLDLRVEEAVPAAALPELLAAAAWHPFDLGRGPLLRVRVWPLAEGGHALLLAVHHLVADFQSLAVLLRELGEIYPAERSGRMARLAPPGAYGDFVRWQQAILAGPRGARLWEHWQERLAGELPVLDLPTDRPRSLLPTGNGVSRRLRLSPAAADRLHGWATASGATLYAALLTGFQALLQRYSGQREILVGSPATLRAGRPGLAETVGYFVNPVVMRTELGSGSQSPSAAALLDRVRATALTALAHQELPFARLAERLRPGGAPGRAPLFQALFVLQPTRRPAERALAALALGEEGARLPLADLSLEPIPWRAERAPFDLTLTAAESVDGLLCALQLDADLFDAATGERMLHHLGALFAGMATHPGRPVGEVDLLTPEEIAQLAAWNATTASAPAEVSLYDLFAAQVERTPEAVALAGSGRRWTYRQLERRAGRLAERLRAVGVGPEVRVGVCAGRSLELVAALLAVWRAGGAYVPLDPTYPVERRAFLLADSRAAVLLGEAQRLAELPTAGVQTVVLPAAADEPAGPPSRQAVLALPENLAYLIYTSGSTGRPKGVAIEHRSAVALVAWAGTAYSDAELAGVLAATSIGFDLSVFELFVPLCHGGQVILAENALALPTLPEAVEVRLINTVPSAMAELVHAGGVPATVLTVNLAGEPLRRPLVRAIALGTAVRRVVNLYGPSEATTYSTWAEQDLAATAEPTLGRPIAYTRAHLEDAALRPVPVGVPGELCLAGAGLGRGYFGQPDLTAERFVPSPYAGNGGEAAGARLYRTGDLVRRRPAGDLEFLGRLDHQVKIRGVRIELGEVESALLACPEVRDAAVLARDGAQGERSLAAFLVASGEPFAVAAVRDALRRSLPEAMVPTAFVLLPELPRTASGKVDRKALAAMAPERPEAGSGGAPRTPLEAELAALWAEVLEVERVGVEDDFFALGGHSLLAARLTARLRERLGVELPLGAVFRAPTVARLAASLPAVGTIADRLLVPPRRKLQDGELSFAQERLWLLERLQPGAAVYHLAGAARLTGRLDAPALHRALAVVVKRHEALRTSFPEVGDRAVQRIAPVEVPELPVIALSDLAGAEREAERLAAAEAVRPFDLARGPLLRARLLRFGSERHLLLLTLHHLIADEASLALLVDELATAYAAFCRGLEPALAATPLQYADFAVWQRERLRGAALESRLTWWTERLAGLPSLDLPTDRPRPAVRGARGAVAAAPLPHPLAERIAGLAPAVSATSFMIFLAAFQALLSRITGAADLAVGCPVSNRDGSRMEGAIGLFVNTLVLRADTSGDPAFRELLARVRETTLAAQEHGDLPFEALVERLQPERSLGRNPLFETAFALQRRPARLRVAGLDLEPFAVPTGTVKFDLTLLAVAGEGQLLLALEHATDLFDRTTAERLLGQLTHLLAGVLEEPDRRLSDLPLLSPAERHQALFEWGAGEAAPALYVPVHHQVEAWAASTPEAVAVASVAGAFTYRELVRRSRRLASVLAARGVGPDAVVAVALERSAEAVIAALAILQAGGVYLPLDPSHPPERLSAIVEDSGARLLIAGESLAAALPAHPAERLALDHFAWEDAGALRAAAEPGPADLAYLIYTSGSTGTPKGAALTHGGLANLVEAQRKIFALGPGTRILQFSPPIFDASIFELVMALASGGTLYVARQHDVLPGPGLIALLEDAAITHLTIPPSALAALPDAPLLILRQLVVAGEACPPGVVRRWAPGRRFSNAYGPTECTVWVTVGEIGPAEPQPPIGRPVRGFDVHVLGPDLAPAPSQVPGQLAVSGRGLARGYWRRPELTAQSFVPHPWAVEPGQRLYLTGDLVRFRADGQLEFLARIDQQVKLRGFRIELGEIEAALVLYPGVRESIALVRDDVPGEKRLVAYLVPARQPGPTGSELRAFLQAKLPDYMVPSAFVALEAIPLTGTGKADRRALPAPSGPEGPRTAPRTPVERVVAEIWAETLGLGRDDLGLEDDFFALGGHSLVAARVVARMREQLGIELPLSALFTYSTVAELAAEADRARGALDLAEVLAAQPLLSQAGDGGDPPPSFSQEQLWFIDLLEPGNPVYNFPVAVRLDGNLDRVALHGALAKIVLRHSVLRTTLGTVEGRPVQVVAKHLLPGLPEVDLAALTPGPRQAEAGRRVAAEALARFDLARGPLFRATLVRLETDRHLLLLTFHHVVTDGWSLRLFFDELAAGYTAAVAGGEPDLPALPIQYADFARWQRAWLRGAVLEHLLAYWRQRLAGAPAALELPFDRPRPPVQTYRGSSQPVALDPAATPALRAFARGESATLFMALLATYATLLHRYTGERDLVLGTPTANRRRVELEPLIGFFANNIALRLDLSGDPTFHDFLSRVRAAVLADYAHQEVPFEKIVEDLRPERDLSHNPIYQVVFALEVSARPERLDLPGLTVTPLPAAEGTAKFDLAFYMEDHGGRLSGLLEVNRDLLDRSTAARWVRHFAALVTAVVEAPERRLSELPFLAPAERHQLLLGARWVSLRGYRIDLRRIEAALAGHPAIEAAVVLPRLGPTGEERLVAYVTARPGRSIPAAEELRAFLAEILPGYMLPGAFQVLSAAPLTREGELDRSALPALAEPPEDGAAPASLAGAAVRIVAEIWQEALKVEKVDPNDNFFSLGGHSLLLLPIQESLRERFGVTVPIVDLFKYPTADTLARHLTALQENSRPAEPERPAEQVRKRVERTRAAVGRGRYVEARRRVETVNQPPVRAAGTEPMSVAEPVEGEVAE